MGDFGRGVRPYWHLLRGQVRSQASYRTSFAVDVAGNLWATVFDVVTVLVMFRITRRLGGFTLREAILITGLSAFAFATADLLFGNADQIRRYVRTGLFDAVLLRPLGALLQLLTMDVPLRKLSRAAFGAAVYLVALGFAGIDWYAGRVALAAVAPLAGMAFFCSLFVAGGTVAFWWVDSGEAANSVTYGGRDFTSYPITVYGGWFRRIFAYGLGFGFVAYYPALALLGRADPIGLPAWVGWVAPFVAVPAVACAALAWRVGVRHYRSTGS
ncbi:MAG TPA: ABC-2 family transporter protein [Micromonosporaceae bacterium]